MAYLEVLRGRRFLCFYGLVIAAIVALGGVVAITTAHAHLAPLPLRFTLGALFLGASYLTAAMVIFLGATLCEASRSRDILLVQPVSRLRIALCWVGIDVAVLAMTFATSVFALAVVLAFFGSPVSMQWRPHFVFSLLLGLGVPFMFYALAQMLPWQYRGNGRAVAVFLWMWIYLSLTTEQFKTLKTWPPLQAAIGYIDVMNPLAYLGHMVVLRSGRVLFGVGGPGVLDLNLESRALLTCLFALAFAAVAVVRWRHAED